MEINTVKNIKLYDVIKSLHLTDKSYKQNSANQSSYAFVLTNPAYSKTEVKEAIEKIFGVSIDSIRTLIRLSHSKSFKGNRKISKVKIAYITLKSGSINYI